LPTLGFAVEASGQRHDLPVVDEATELTFTDEVERVGVAERVRQAS
jgi:hypothetical protein